MEKNINKAQFPFGKKVAARCPYIEQSLEGCYCTDMKSTRVEEAIYYCGSNYAACPVYKELKSKGKEQFAGSVTGEAKAIGL